MDNQNYNQQPQGYPPQQPPQQPPQGYPPPPPPPPPGYPPPPPPQGGGYYQQPGPPPGGVPNPGKVLGIVALILGISSIVACYVPVFGLAAAIVGMILAINSKKKAASVGAAPGVAKPAQILSIIGLVLSIIWNIVWLACGSALCTLGALTDPYYW